MNRLASMLVALILVASTADAASGWYRKIDEATRAAKAEDQLIFVDLFADWCKWCHEFDRVIVPSEPFQNATRNMVLLRVDIEDRGEGAALARRYNATRLPTFLVLTPDQALAAMVQGFAPPAEFVAQMNAQLAAYQKFENDLKREPGKPPQERLELARQLIGRYDYREAEARLGKLVAGRIPAAVAAEAFYLLAEAQRGQGKHEAAIASATAVLERQAKGDVAERAWLLRATVRIDQEKYAAALADFRKFKATYPDSPLVGTVDYYLPRLEAYVAKNAGR